MRIHHLNCGTFCPVGELFINGSGSPFRTGRLVCHCLLLETSDGLVLVDTGIGTTALTEPKAVFPGRLWRMLNRPRLKAEETALYQLGAMGLKADDVRHVVLTHLDFDHAGGLPDFPRARVHVMEDEFRAAMARATPRERMRYAPRQFAHNPDWALYRPDGENWHGFKAVRPLHGLGDDILLVPLPGHSRGHCGVAVLGQEGWLLNCGDAVFHHGELDRPERHCPPGLRLYQNIFQYDRDARMENQRRLRELVQRTDGRVRVFCSHDPMMMDHFAGEPALTRKQGLKEEIEVERLQMD